MLVIAIGEPSSPRLGDPREAGHLAVAVQPMVAGKTDRRDRATRARADDGHAGADRPLADDKVAFAAHYRRVPDPNALDVGNRVERARACRGRRSLPARERAPAEPLRLDDREFGPERRGQQVLPLAGDGDDLLHDVVPVRVGRRRQAWLDGNHVSGL